MGMEAVLMAMGPYSPAVREFLEYGDQFYSGTKIGTTVLTTVFICNTSDSSRGLAQALGIDPWDFNQHFIPAERLDSMRQGDVKAWAEELGQREDWLDFEALRAHGFTFIYRPNG